MSLLEKLFHEENYNRGALSLPDLHYAQFPKKQWNTFSYNHPQNIWDKLWFSCEIAHCGKNSISISLEILASADSQFGGTNKCWAIILWSLEVFLIFPDFLISEVIQQLVRQLVCTSLLLIIRFISLVVNINFGQSSESLETLWTWL